MNKLKLAICDGDEIYCHRLDEYLHSNLKLSFEIFSFTDVSILCDFVKDDAISLLIISEELFLELRNSGMIALFKNILVLDEGVSAKDIFTPEDTGETRIEHLIKFQEASHIVDGVIDFCVNDPDEFSGASIKASMTNGNIIGFYTPVSRCGQTTVARELAKSLAAKGKTIFLSFESFSSLPYLVGATGREDMTDLLYYAECEKTKVSIFLEKIKVSKEGVDYILPARTSMQLKDISFEKMKSLLELLIHEAGYEYIVLDMTDYPEDFLNILLLCKRIITIVREKPSDSFRQKQYEEVLMDSGYEEIHSRTKKVLLPDIRDKRAFDACIAEMIRGDNF